jgi:5'-nucleotidase/UDP-sugar diphosphatase
MPTWFAERGDDLRVAEAVPGIDVVFGGHSHTALQEAIIVNGRTPVVQPGSTDRTSANW